MTPRKALYSITLFGKLIRLWSIAPVFVSLAAAQSATGYLQQTSDQYQHTLDVYTDAGAAGNHFAARGEFDSTNGVIQVPAMDEISSNAPCFGITCITASFDPTSLAWGGWYFMNGTLFGNQREPSPNWGTLPNIGYDLTGATTLQFWARGVNGGENVQFFAFGVGWNPNTDTAVAPYPESSLRVSNGPVTLSTNWTQYQIDLTGLNIDYVLGGFGWVASAGAGANTAPISFYIDNIQYLKERPNDPRFLLSYQTIKSTNSFDTVERNTAYVYDNSVALIALIAAGDVTRARTIADALLYAQANDRFFTDGRLRNAYQAGDLALPPGWLPNNKPNTVRMPGWYDPTRTTWFEDETQVSSNTGNIAWAILALLGFYRVTQEQQYLQGAQELGSWVIANTWDNRGTGGFTGGYDGWENGAAAGSASTCASNVFVNGQCKRLYKSTEHNIDLYSAFAGLYLADGSQQWAQAAGNAKTFFLSMWDNSQGKFWIGTIEDGVTISTDPIPVDIQAWSLLALGSEAALYERSLSYVEDNAKTALGYGFKQDGGNACGDNTWFEGTSQVATAYLLTGNASKWQSILNDVHSAQLSSGAVPATDGACLNTGLVLDDGQPWIYYPRAHVGATAWFNLAELGVNPYMASLYAPPLIQVAVGADGTMWGLDPFGDIYVRNSDGQFWTPVPGQLSQIAVGSANAIWGVNAAGEIYQWSGQAWNSIPGNLQQIVVGSDGDVWGLNSFQFIYHFNAAAHGWDQIPGTLAQIAVGYDGAVWGLNFDGEIYRYNVGSQIFQRVPGLLTQISVGADGDVWGVNSQGQVYHYNTLKQSWESIAGENLKQVAVGSGTNVWGISAAGQVYQFNNQNQNWTSVPVTLSRISATQNGAAWGSDSSNNIYELSAPTEATETWHQIPGELTAVELAPDGNVWGINNANQIFTFNPLTQSWTWIPGELAQVAVGADATVWGINSFNQIYTFNVADQSWSWIPGSLSQISTNGNGDEWGINSIDQIYRFNAANQSWTWVPGSLSQLSVGVDGAVWGTNSDDQIWKFNAAGQSWTWIPGSLMRVAVGSSKHVCGINAEGGVYCFDAQTQSWNYLPGVFLTQIAVGFDGALWGIDALNQIWQFNWQTQNWIQIPGSLTQIAVGADSIVWGVNSTGSIFRYW
jgi:hypothetical protein